MRYSLMGGLETTERAISDTNFGPVREPTRGLLNVHGTHANSSVRETRSFFQHARMAQLHRRIIEGIS